MIITGRLLNQVSCTCYEIEAIPDLQPPASKGQPCEPRKVTREKSDTFPRGEADAQGDFKLVVDDADAKRWFGTRPARFFFTIHSAGKLIRSTENQVYWTPKSRTVPIDLCAPQAPPLHGKVCGKVTDCRGKGVAGLYVTVFDVDLYDKLFLSQELGTPAVQSSSKPKPPNPDDKKTSDLPKNPGTSLGTAVTNHCGEYCVCYTRRQYIEGDIRTADIRVTVSEEAKPRKFLQWSKIVYNAEAKLTVNLSVSGSLLDGSSEFTEYHEALNKLRCDTPTKRRSLNEQQLEFISEEGSIPIEHLELLRKAYEDDHQWFSSLGISSPFPHFFPQVLYGLYRTGVIGEIGTWVRRYHGSAWNNLHATDKLASILDLAISNCVIERRFGLPTPVDFKKVALLMWGLSAYFALTAPVRPNRSSWLELFSLIITLFPSSQRFSEFLLMWLHFGHGEPLYAELKKQQTLSSNALAQLKEFFTLAEIAEWYAPAVRLFLADRNKLVFAAGSDPRWSNYFKSPGLNPLPLNTSFPEYSVAVRNRARMQYGSESVANWAANPGAISFPPQLGLSAAEAAKAAKRISRLTTNVDFADQLASRGFTSARVVASLRWQDFAGQMGNSVDALHTFTKAREVAAITAATNLQLVPLLNSPFGAGRPSYFSSLNLSSTRLQHSTAESLFGTGSACDCEGRLSVFSPAAYLYYLRRFIAGIPGATTKVDQRRPEMIHNRLTQANCFKPLPLIDLNLELMEDLIARSYLGLSPTPAPQDRQTTEEMSQLDLKPAFTNTQVYTALKTIIRPWALPFDLEQYSRRVLLEALKVGRAEWWNITHLAPSVWELGRCSLDLSQLQYELIEAGIGATSAYTQITVNSSSGQPVSQIDNKALTVMRDSGLSFQELYMATQAAKVFDTPTNPQPLPSLNVDRNGTPLGVSPGAGCNPEEYFLCESSGTMSPINTTQAERLHRFVRLWHCLQWPMHWLNWAIGAFRLETCVYSYQQGTTTLKQEDIFPLKWLGAAEMIRKRLGLEVHEVIAFWSPISQDSWSLPFIQNPELPSAWQKIMKVNDQTIPPLAAIAALCEVTEAFASQMVGTTPTVVGASKIYRYGRLSKVLGIRPEVLLQYEELRGFAIFESPASTWAAIEEINVAIRSGADLADVIPWYYQRPDGNDTVRGRKVALAIQETNQRLMLPVGQFTAGGLSFEMALETFCPSDTARDVAGMMSALGSATPTEKAKITARISELLGLPLDISTTLTEQALLTMVSEHAWQKSMWPILAEFFQCSASTVKLFGENVTDNTTQPHEPLRRVVEGFIGDGGVFTNWPDQTDPTQLARFLDEGIISIKVAANTTRVITLTGHILLGDPGEYVIRAKVLLPATLPQGASIRIMTSDPLNQGTIDVCSLTVAENGGPAYSLFSSPQTASFSSNVSCEIQLELVDPSGHVAALPGARILSSPGPVTSLRNALELLGLSRSLQKQWNIPDGDMIELIKLGAANTLFPQFPPRGSVQRPIQPSTQFGDRDGFDKWFTYAGLVAAIRMVKASNRKAFFDAARLQTGQGQPISEALEVQEELISNAFASLTLTSGNFSNGVHWLRLIDLVKKEAEWGVTASTLAGWCGDNLNSSELTSLDLAGQFRLSTNDAYRKVADKIRVMKRDRLADYLIAQIQPLNWTGQWGTRRDISDYLLSDIEMEPPTDTSRVRFSIAGIQRFITQVTSQKEGLSLTADQDAEWSSTYEYRLWEVRQKILLYPEIWLKFGRHLHKSPEAVELDRSLLQGNLTDEMAEEALIHFTEGLHAVGHLEIVGTCPQQEYDATGALSTNLLHVIGRTPAEPRQYYHRTRVDDAYWTPWHKIELDIDCDQIVPYVHHRRLHLFWPVISTQAQEKSEIVKDDRQLGLEDSYKTIRLAWSVLTTKGWKPKMLSQTVLSTRFGHYAKNQALNFAFGNAYVEVHAWNQASQNPSDYQLRPVLSDEGDAVLEVFAPLESISITRSKAHVPEWLENLLFIGDELADEARKEINQALNSTLNSIRGTINQKLLNATPAIPPSATTGNRKEISESYRMLGYFRLTPDNLVDVRQRRTGLPQPDSLNPAERARTLATIGTAQPTHGAFEFLDGTIELHTNGAYRKVLDSAGAPVRVVDTRQEPLPTQEDPIFCRIKNRSFIAFKLSYPAPPAPNLDTKYTASNLRALFGTAPREQVQRQARMIASGNPSQPSSAVAAVTNHMAQALQIERTTSSWRFMLAHHPQSIELLRAVRMGLSTLYSLETQQDPRAATNSMSTSFDFDADYAPVDPWVDKGAGGAHLPKDELEFLQDQASAIHNWELLYHSAMIVGAQMIKIRNFEQSRKWIARVFNPRESLGAIAPEKYWVFKPFHDHVQSGGVSDFNNLDPSGSADPYKQQVFKGLIRQWQLNPFNPHAVASFRPQAYQLAALFLYVENLIAWGDFLFAIPSAEKIEEAARRFEEADLVIGRKPHSTGALQWPSSPTGGPTLGSVLSGVHTGSDDLETELSTGNEPAPLLEGAFTADLGLGFFCLPPSPKFKELRDKIADRLFKVHHSLDLLGNPRKVPLYDPPIDPALLAEAGMAGLNVSQIVMDAYTPRPHRRSSFLFNLTKSFTQQSISLGSGLLAAMEKKDAEALSLLRASHEVDALSRATVVRKLQLDEAQAALKAQEGTLASAENRLKYYESREFMNAEEVAQLAFSILSTTYRLLGQAFGAGASSSSAVPDFLVGGAGMASPVALTKSGGENISRVLANLVPAVNAVGELYGMMASLTGSMGSYRRRQDDWEFQAETAKLDIKQTKSQILGAKIRCSIAEREATNHEKQLAESRDVYDFLNSKQTSLRLYEWLESEIGATYLRSFQLAQNLALQTQRAVQDELGISQRFIGLGQWDSSHFGLHAGERLLQELSEMEAFVYQQPRPATKKIEISLAQIDPIALAELKVKGSCQFQLSEEFWNAHAPHLYFKRFHSVTVSTPGVTGPYSGVHGQLTLKKASYRKEPTLINGKFDPIDNDPRVVIQFPSPSDSITLSTGKQDTGYNPDNIQDGYKRPMEDMGVCATFECVIPQQGNTFDLRDLADVVLHVEYTGKDGGASYTSAAKAYGRATEGIVLSLNHQFPAEWEKLTAGNIASIDLRTWLPVGELGRNGKRIMKLNACVVVRTTSVPANSLNFTLTPPGTLSAPKTVSVAFLPLADGAKRFGFGEVLIAPQPNTAPPNYEQLSSTWSLQAPAGSTVLEDAILVISWKLG